MLVLLVLSSIAAALIPVERNSSEESTTTTSTATTAPPSDEGRLIVRRVSADAQKPQTVRMHVGDELRLTVTSPVPNTVEIEEFGDFEYVDPNFPARFDVLPFDEGRFPVRLVDPPALVATIAVTP